jgi:hypothetical protein
MKAVPFFFLFIFFFVSCKSEVCECADIHVKAAKEINKFQDPVKKMQVLSAKKYQVAFKKCNKLTEKMNTEELKAFEKEYKQCPSIKAFQKSNQPE